MKIMKILLTLENQMNKEFEESITQANEIYLKKKRSILLNF